MGMFSVERILLFADGRRVPLHCSTGIDLSVSRDTRLVRPVSLVNIPPDRLLIIGSAKDTEEYERILASRGIEYVEGVAPLQSTIKV
jgi:hypothetical protein